MIASSRVTYMKKIEYLEQAFPSADEIDPAPNEADYCLNIMGVYQDTVSRSRAMQMCHRATQLAGEERVKQIWYNDDSLGDEAILRDAVRSALMADVIVVSLYSADELSLGFCSWVNEWVPRRASRVGALVALVGLAEHRDSLRTLKYLQSVADNAQLDFMHQERDWPDTVPVCSGDVLPGQNSIYG